MLRFALLASLALLVVSCSGSSERGGDVVPYPLDTCIVTENRLGSMGTPITKVYDGREVKFCCAPCVDEFEASPKEFLDKLPK
jgi:YHS domain-containing protein